MLLAAVLTWRARGSDGERRRRARTRRWHASSSRGPARRPADRVLRRRRRLRDRARAHAVARRAVPARGRHLAGDHHASPGVAALASHLLAGSRPDLGDHADAGARHRHGRAARHERRRAAPAGRYCGAGSRCWSARSRSRCSSTCSRSAVHRDGDVRRGRARRGARPRPARRGTPARSPARRRTRPPTASPARRSCARAGAASARARRRARARARRECPRPGSPGRRAGRPAARSARCRGAGGSSSSTRRRAGPAASCGTRPARPRSSRFDDQPAALPGGGGEPVGVVGAVGAARRAVDVDRRRPAGQRDGPAHPCDRSRSARSRSARRSPARPRPRRTRSDGCAVGGQPRAEPARPRTTPATAIASPSTKPSGNSAAGHGRTIQTCVQPHSAASPTVPSAAPEASANGSGRRTSSAIALDQQRLDHDTAGSAAVGSPSTGPDEQRHQPAHREEEQRRAERRAAAEPDPRGDERHARREHDQHRLEDHPELRHAEVELGLEGREPEQERARQRDPPHPADPRYARRRPAAAFAAPASTSSTASPISVIAAPPISIRCVGPHSVTSCPNSRCQTSSSGKPISANVPARRDQARRPAARTSRRRSAPPPATASPAAGTSTGSPTRTRRTARRG